MADSEKKPIWESSILRTAALVTAIVIIITQLNNLLSTTKSVGPEFYKIILSGINAIILLSYCFISPKIPKLEFNNDNNGKTEYSKIFNLFNDQLSSDDSIKLAEQNNRRVNLLAKQLNLNIIYFALILSVTYVLYIFDDTTNPKIHVAFKVAEDLSNFLSSVFLYLAFKVLYDKTLENDESNSKYNYYVDAIIVSGLYIMAYVFFVIVDVNTKIDTSVVNNIFSLLSGIFNGLAMTLLFARYISMEHSVSRINKVNYSDIISLLTILLLPLYTLAQPLFGIFDIKSFGDASTFQNCVFLICLLGKAFFLYISYYFFKRKLIHLYLHMVLTRHDTANEVANCFKLEDK